MGDPALPLLSSLHSLKIDSLSTHTPTHTPSGYLRSQNLYYLSWPPVAESSADGTRPAARCSNCQSIIK